MNVPDFIGMTIFLYYWVYSPIVVYLYMLKQVNKIILIFSLFFFIKIPWIRDWLSIPVFLPEESHGQRSLADYSPWGAKNRTRLSD